MVATIGCGSSRQEKQPQRTRGFEDVNPALAPAWTPSARSPPAGSAMAVAEDQPERCAIRLTARGITVDGEPMPRTRAVALCKQRSAALVEIADGANERDWLRLRGDLDAAGVRILLRGSRGHDEDGCRNNPLARGCF